MLYQTFLGSACLPACSTVYYRTEARQELIKEGYKKGIKKKKTNEGTRY
jgi:hypothetical protein